MFITDHIYRCHRLVSHELINYLYCLILALPYGYSAAVHREFVLLFRHTQCFIQTPELWKELTWLELGGGEEASPNR